MDYEHPLDHPGDEPAPAFSASAMVRACCAPLTLRAGKGRAGLPCCPLAG